MWVQQKLHKAVGDVLTAARERSGLTQQQLGLRLKKPQSFISSYENGQRRIDVLELMKIAQELGADPVKLYADIVVAQGDMRRRRA